MKTILARVDDEMYVNCERVCSVEDRSLSSLIRVALRGYLGRSVRGSISGSSQGVTDKVIKSESEVIASTDVGNPIVEPQKIPVDDEHVERAPAVTALDKRVNAFIVKEGRYPNSKESGSI